MELTVIVTVYNIAEYLPRFFESMASQTFRNYTLLMIDDGSEDNSLQVCRKYAKEDDRIEVVSLEHVGIAKARNIAMEYIKSEFTAYADGDDYVEPDYLQHLMDAQKKHMADLVISRVAYHQEGSNNVEGAFPERGEMCFTRDEFEKKLPMLLDDRRLNYLYSKVYRSDLLKSITVEDDVRQGSDTMMNCQYIANIQRIVLIDDLDYHYIKYNTRSVTSYSGEDAFYRICRINKFIYFSMREQKLLTEEMERIIVKRVLLSAIWVVERIIGSEGSKAEKIRQIDAIVRSEEYRKAISRYKNEPWDIGFSPIYDKSGKDYIERINRDLKMKAFKARVLSISPKWLHNCYRTVFRKQ